MTKRTATLLIDIGNTSVTYGVDRGQKRIRASRVDTADCSPKRVEKIIADVSNTSGIAGAIISSVVPRKTRTWCAAIRRICGTEPVLVDHHTSMPICIDYPRPATIGPDRLANASGAVDRYGAPVIVADFGTALTFDVVSPEAKYIGGAIVPGLPFMTDYLAERTALLPHIQLKAPRHPVGKSTVEAMQVGARVGYRGMVREIFTHLVEAMDCRHVTLCATGGHAAWVLDGLNMDVHLDSDLTLHGLRVIYGMGRG
jgi:type III pantothenate kinase